MQLLATGGVGSWEQSFLGTAQISRGLLGKNVEVKNVKLDPQTPKLCQ